MKRALLLLLLACACAGVQPRADDPEHEKAEAENCRRQDDHGVGCAIGMAIDRAAGWRK